jgi:two-component system, chemotaxis family, protein-glutamate methylesterase/glutaminase
MTPAERAIDVLIVDDAVVVRRIVGDVLAEDSGIRVVGTAANGRIALQKLTQVQPQLVTLDFEMPEMNGLETLKAIRKSYPRLPVIMFSTMTLRGARETLDALAAGASDYVTKPANVGSVGEAKQRIREELIPKIKALCGVASVSVLRKPVAVAPRIAVPVRPARGTRPEAVVIGVSTGGPNALATLIPQIPPDFSLPIAIVQHMPPMFTKLLADRLNAQSGLNVVEAQGGEVLRAGSVYIAPGGYHMTLKRQGAAVVTALDQDPPENSCRPAVDVLFRSACTVYGERLLGVVMTGMGQDGLRGSEAIRRLNGQVVVQDEATSVVWGMPGFVAQAGLADAVIPLNQIASEIVRRCAVMSSKPIPR